MNQVLVPITILVPIENIDINAEINYEPETRDTPHSYDVSINELSILGLIYDIEYWDSELIDDKAIENWENDTSSI